MKIGKNSLSLKHTDKTTKRCAFRESTKLQNTGEIQSESDSLTLVLVLLRVHF
jgi:hypothetical protein